MEVAIALITQSGRGALNAVDLNMVTAADGWGVRRHFGAPVSNMSRVFVIPEKNCYAIFYNQQLRHFSFSKPLVLKGLQVK
jgi:hypothetical protein